MLSEREVGLLLMGIGGVSMLVVYILIISLRKAKGRIKKSTLIKDLIINNEVPNIEENPMYT
jgi:hypothetical protein